MMDEFKHLIHVPFKFEFAGSQIIHYDPEEDYLAQEETRAAQQIQAFREADRDSITE